MKKEFSMSFSHANSIHNRAGKMHLFHGPERFLPLRDEFKFRSKWKKFILNNLVLGHVTNSVLILSYESGLTLIHEHQQKCAIYPTTDISLSVTFSFFVFK